MMDTGPLTLNGYYMQIFLRIYYLFGAIKTMLHIHIVRGGAGGNTFTTNNALQRSPIIIHSS